MHKLFKQVRKRPVTHVVEKPSDFECQDVVRRDAQRVQRLKVIPDPPSEVGYSDGMFASRVRRGRIYQRAPSQLTDLVKALKGLRAAQDPRQGREVDLSVDTIAHASVVHLLLPRVRLVYTETLM